MTKERRAGTGWKGRSISCLLLVAAILAAFAAPSPAEERGRFNQLRSLFTTQQPPASRRLEHPAPRRKLAAPQARKRTAKKRPPPAAQAAPPAALPKSGDARVLLVVGDEAGAALARGLAERFAREPSVRVVERTRGSSGLIPTPETDWLALLPAMIETERAAAVIVMLGTNDRRRMTVAGERQKFGGSAWTAAYSTRAAGLVQAVEGTGRPLLWVGLPAVRSAKASLGTLAVNELFRAAAEAGGGTFVDTWEGFVDEAGAFVTHGPDVDGLPARLRTGDGAGFTAAGRRKLAFFAERALAKLPGLPPVGREPETPSVLPGEAASLLRPGQGKPVSLDGYETATGQALLGDPASPVTMPQAGGQAPFDPPAVAGRADDFRVNP